MTIQEALKSKKRARNTSLCLLGWRTLNDYTFTKEEILSEDWELEPDPKPRMIAWLFKYKSPHPGGGISADLRFYPDGADTPDRWIRAPWLDEPEEK